jgi:carbon monoxide dehydrogenase subunit G
MAAALERQYDTTLRIEAPLDAVWEEIRTIDRILKRAPEVDEFELEPDGRATWRGRFVSGRFHRDVIGRAEIVDLAEGRNVTYTTTIPTLEARFNGIFALAPGGEDVTVMGYRGAFVCRHRFAWLMRQPLTAILEDHVLSVPARVGQLAHQHAAFERQMNERAAGSSSGGQDARPQSAQENGSTR